MKPFLKSHPEGTLLALKAQPRASRNEISEAIGAELKIKITAPPVDSAATKAIIEFLSEKLDCPKSAIAILRGETSRYKQILLRGVKPEQVEAMLASP